MKILGFDSWLGGFRSFKRLNSEFEKNGIDFKLVHISSWSNNTRDYKEKEFGQIVSSDISNYKTINFDKILEKEKPDAVVMLSVDVFAHKSMIRTCKRFNIPVIHLFHGIMSALSVNEKVTYSRSIFSKVLFALPRIPKYIRFIVPNYFIAVSKDNLIFKGIVIFFKTLFKFLSGRNIIKADNDSQTNLCLVFNKLDAIYAINKYDYSEKSVKIVGSPDLYEFYFDEKLVDTYSTEFESSEYVLYLDSVPFLRGIMTYEDNYEYLLKIHKQLKSNNKKLAIKLHPEHKQTGFSERLMSKGIVVVEKEELISYIKKSSYIISEATSLFQIPALMGWPVYVSCASKFKLQKYGELISTYNNSYTFNEFEELGKLHQSNVLVDKKWKEDNLGPLPFEEFPKRVVENIIDIANEFNKYI